MWGARGKPKLIWTIHAKNQMRRRQISEQEVIAVIETPTFTFKKEGTTRRRLVSTIGGRRISVVLVTNEHSEDVVITVWSPDEEDEES